MKMAYYWVGRSSLIVDFGLGMETWIPRAAQTCQLLALVHISFTCGIDIRETSFPFSVYKFFPMGLSTNPTSNC